MQKMDLSTVFGDEVDDPEEEHFLLFSASFPSSNLGFISSTSAELELSVAGEDLSIQQSPGLLSSNVASGTTGAVLWKITPLVAEWLADQEHGFLAGNGPLKSPGGLWYHGEDGHVNGANGHGNGNGSGSGSGSGSGITVLELGSGVAGMLALTLRKQVARYIATDLEPILKGLRRNLVANGAWSGSNDPVSATSRNKAAGGGRKKLAKHSDRIGSRTPPSAVTAAASTAAANTYGGSNVEAWSLDWEDCSAPTLKASIPDLEQVDLIIACDCVYNEALVRPFVDTCAQLCRLASATAGRGGREGEKKVRRRAPVLVLVAQQLRSDLVFDTWIREFHRQFRTWRVPDHMYPTASPPPQQPSSKSNNSRDHSRKNNNNNGSSVDADTGTLRAGSGYVVHVGILRNAYE